MVTRTTFRGIWEKAFLVIALIRLPSSRNINLSNWFLSISNNCIQPRIKKLIKSFALAPPSSRNINLSNWFLSKSKTESCIQPRVKNTVKEFALACPSDLGPTVDTNCLHHQPQFESMKISTSDPRMISFSRVFAVVVALLANPILLTHASEGGLRHLVPEADCASVLCARPDCAEDEIWFTPPGQCCSMCKKSPCAQTNKKCKLEPVCAPGQFILVTPKDCCGSCVGGGSQAIKVDIDCRLVRCALPIGCNENQYITQPGSCCPRCPGPQN